MEFAMMSYQSESEPTLFCYNVNLAKRVPQKHILRRIKKEIDFDFIYAEVKDTYGTKGNLSVPPPIILKMLLLLVLYNVRSERELMDTIPMRLDWLWFLGYDLDSDIPNHSVLSKARARWGVEAFKLFFERIVWQCVEAGLVDGKKLFVDASLIDANASNNSVVDTQGLERYVNESYEALEQRLDDAEEQKTTPANSRYSSTTDPDASVIRQGKGNSKLRYKTHRAVDPNAEVITATKVTAGSRDEGDLLEEMITAHEHNTEHNVDTVVTDSKYGKIDNFLLCHDLGIKAHMPSIEQTHRGSGRQKGIFPKEAFIYNPEEDTFTCPAGQILNRRNYSKKRRYCEYKAFAKTCAQCHLRANCTRAKDGRTLKRHLRQEVLESMLTCANSRESKKDLKTRQHLSERSFAQSKRYGYKTARWRRLWRMKIQDFLIAAVQNIRILINHPRPKAQSNAAALMGRAWAHTKRAFSSIWAPIFALRIIWTHQRTSFQCMLD